MRSTERFRIVAVAVVRVALAATLVAGGCTGTAAGRPAPATDVTVPVRDAVSDATTPKSVVLLIGDGMGPQQVGLLLDWADAAGVAPTAFERLSDDGSLGLLRTGAEGTPLTDSAAGATALACGVDVPNGFIATDRAGASLRTCLEDARESGRATGLVTTTRLTHATPAAFASHVPQRNREREIGVQLLASRVDVMLGGGAQFLDADAAAAAGYHVVRSPEQLAGLAPGTSPLIGVFAPSHMPFAIDRNAADEARAPTLADMTRAALYALAMDPDGFFLMVEGGRIDHAGHANDAAALLGEMREFDDAIGVATAFREAHPDTLVVVTADHETGGLGLSAGGRPLLPADLLEMSRATSSFEALAPPPAERAPVDPAVFGVGRRRFYPPYSAWETSRAIERSAAWNVSFATAGHTATPVPIVASGPGEGQFRGIHENEAVGVLLRRWMARPASGGLQ